MRAWMWTVLACAACNGVDGGPCSYDEVDGTCTGDSDGTFTFSGTEDGQAVSYAGNTASDPLDEGESVDCTLSRITSGTCTPCILDLGECGSEAFGGP